ncbi:hypothetical protein scyTo_0025174, partial [Scyliorhinus torazame]|nr:hypothetical protein [Scyliorhinus torazame]
LLGDAWISYSVYIVKLNKMLREPKTDLIHRVVKTVGRKKAIELLIQTAEVEQSGGLMIVVSNTFSIPKKNEHMTFKFCPWGN